MRKCVSTCSRCNLPLGPSIIACVLDGVLDPSNASEFSEVHVNLDLDPLTNSPNGRRWNMVALAQFAFGFALAMSISYCISISSRLWLANANAVSGRIWALVCLHAYAFIINACMYM